MNDQIRKAFELADGWRLGVELLQTPSGNVVLMDDKVPQLYLDALAAQLVRQVDAIGDRYFLECQIRHTRITEMDLYQMPKQEWYGRGPNRTMNTIRAIVDSGVLE